MSKKTCTIDGCDQKMWGRGYCALHYSRWLHSGDPSGKKTKVDPSLQCTVEGCANRRTRNGFCGAHYSRVRKYGHPDAKRPIITRAGRGDLLAWLEAHIEFESEECLVWPFAINQTTGYGEYKHKRKTKQPHIYMCERVHGARPTPHHEVAHECGNRACVNHQHLRWDTHAGNQADMVRHGRSQRGTKNHFTKLTPEQVLEIRKMARHRTKSEIGDMYGVTRQAIGLIARRVNWAWLDDAA